MSYLRSRRFYVGLAIGLLPLLLIAATLGNDTNDREPERVLVRNYSTCPDSTAASRTAALLETLPPGGVLVENFAGCCCGHGHGAHHHGTANPPRGTTGPIGRVHSAPAPRTDDPLIPAEEPAELLALMPTIAEQPLELGMPSFSGFETAERSRSAAWFALLAAPLLFISRGVRNDRPYPEGIICPDDSGLPTGPMRPRC